MTTKTRKLAPNLKEISAYFDEYNLKDLSKLDKRRQLVEWGGLTYIIEDAKLSVE